MAMGPQVPEVPRSPGPPGPAGGRGAGRTAAWCLALLAGSVLLGLLGGVIWSEIAPRALLEEVGKGTAEVVNVETRAFFGADVWFCAIAAVAGLLTGLLGYPLAVARHDGYARAAVTLALILGALAGGLAMLWLGDRLGSSAYQHQLASSASGTLFSSSLSLGAKSALALWPLLTGVVLLVAEWGRRPEPAGQPAGQPA
jgi:hypothetical protein